jgi:hypothetical protein
VVSRWALLTALALACAAGAEGVNGAGRVSVGGGFRWVPNWWFKDRAAALGLSVAPGLDGGAQGTASFGYGVTSLFELSVDLILGYHSLALSYSDHDEPVNSLSAGALLGPRLVGTDVLFKGLMPWLGVQVGPLLSNIATRVVMVPEKVVLALSASAGLNWKVSDRYGVGLEARYVMARNNLPDIAGINVGGVWFSATFTLFFPPQLKRDLDVPGF